MCHLNVHSVIEDYSLALQNLGFVKRRVLEASR